jgi:hypothetical protein
MPCYQKAGQNHNMKTVNRSFEIVAEIKYFLKIITNQNFVHEEIKRRLHLGIACYLQL